MHCSTQELAHTHHPRRSPCSLPTAASVPAAADPPAALQPGVSAAGLCLLPAECSCAAGIQHNAQSSVPSNQGTAGRQELHALCIVMLVHAATVLLITLLTRRACSCTTLQLAHFVSSQHSMQLSRKPPLSLPCRLLRRKVWRLRAARACKRRRCFKWQSMLRQLKHVSWLSGRLSRFHGLVLCMCRLLARLAPHLSFKRDPELSNERKCVPELSTPQQHAHAHSRSSHRPGGGRGPSGGSAQPQSSVHTRQVLDGHSWLAGPTIFKLCCASHVSADRDARHAASICDVNDCSLQELTDCFNSFHASSSTLREWCDARGALRATFCDKSSTARWFLTILIRRHFVNLACDCSAQKFYIIDPFGAAPTNHSGYSTPLVTLLNQCRQDYSMQHWPIVQSPYQLQDDDYNCGIWAVWLSQQWHD